jgi:hypothetical protein
MNRAQAQKYFEKHKIRCVLSRRADGRLGPADPTDDRDKPCYDYQDLYRTREATAGVLAHARACGKQDVHHLEKEDLVALTVEAAAMAAVPLAGTSWIPGR